MLCLLQGIKRECKALPLTVRQMIVQQVQLEAIKRREAVSPSILQFKYSICTCALLVASSFLKALISDPVLLQNRVSLAWRLAVLR